MSKKPRFGKPSDSQHVKQFENLHRSISIKEIIGIGDNFDYDKLSFTGGNKKIYGLKNFKTLEKLIKDINKVDMKIDEAELKQNKFAKRLDELIAYPAMGSKYIGLKESASKNLRKNI